MNKKNNKIISYQQNIENSVELGRSSSEGLSLWIHKDSRMRMAFLIYTAGYSTFWSQNRSPFYISAIRE